MKEDYMDETYEDETYEDDECMEDEIFMDDYCEYPFAMEVANGEIINMTGEVQREMRRRLAANLHMSEEELLSRLESVSDTAEMPEGLPYMEPEALHCLLDGNNGFGFLACEYGWEAKELLEYLGFKVEENVINGPHGHGTYGVCYIAETECAGG